MSLKKAEILNQVTQERIPVMFNPEEYTLNRENNFAQIAVPGLSAPLIQFVNGNQQTLEMELFLDTHEEHRQGSNKLNRAGDDVRKLVNKVIGLMDIERTTHAPPILRFTWSSLSFDCVLSRATQRFVMFSPDGTPVRARLTVTFSQFRSLAQELKETKRETADYTKLHVVKQGETLQSIAAREYGDPRIWRPIALRNDVDDPRKVQPGTQLMLPRLPYRDPASGKVYS
jgi:hypothetical protein